MRVIFQRKFFFYKCQSLTFITELALNYIFFIVKNETYRFCKYNYIIKIKQKFTFKNEMIKLPGILSLYLSLSLECKCEKTINLQSLFLCLFFSLYPSTMVNYDCHINSYIFPIYLHHDYDRLDL